MRGWQPGERFTEKHQCGLQAQIATLEGNNTDLQNQLKAGFQRCIKQRNLLQQSQNNLQDQQKKLQQLQAL